MAIDGINGVAAQITGAIRQAARSTGMSFEYLLTTAKIESSLNPAAQAVSSTAKGLYQFIDQTWLATMKTTGAALGYGRYADAIVQNGAGQYEVPDAAARNAIMRLRTDPAASALMAGAFARGNAAQLAQSIGRAPTEGELYIAHFLGPDGAAKLIAAASSQPRANAATMFPQAASANTSIFYAGGSPRSVGEVYAKLTARFDAARSVAVTANLRGTLSAQDTTQDTARNTAAVAQAFAAVSAAQPVAQQAQPIFQGMFSDRARGGLTQTVNQLWTRPGTDTGGARPVSLFTDRLPEPRKPSGS
jgi:hypothetical protein